MKPKTTPHVPDLQTQLETMLHQVWRSEADGPSTGEGTKITPCAVCGEPATYLGYDGLDPSEQRNPHTGRAWSADIARYRPVCVAH